MNVNSTNGVSFQAQLNISKVGAKNKVRWQGLVDEFEKKSLGLEGMVKVSTVNGDTVIDASVDDFRSKTCVITAITNQMNELFEKYDKNAIEKELVKFLRIGKAVKLKKDFLTQEYQNLADAKSWINSDVFYDKLNEKIQSVNDVTMKHLEKDGFWNNFEIIL